MVFQPKSTVFRAYVGGIGIGATELEVRAAFARVGVQLTCVELVVNRATGCLRGFAFVAIAEDPTALQSVLARMRLALIDGRPLTVQLIAHGSESEPEQLSA